MTETQWVAYAKKHLVGQRIVSARYTTESEREGNGWNCRPVVLELDNGTQVFPMQDDEGNDGGALEVIDREGTSHLLPVL